MEVEVSSFEFAILDSSNKQLYSMEMKNQLFKAIEDPAARARGFYQFLSHSSLLSYGLVDDITIECKIQISGGKGVIPKL